MRCLGYILEMLFYLQTTVFIHILVHSIFRYKKQLFHREFRVGFIITTNKCIKQTKKITTTKCMNDKNFQYYTILLQPDKLELNHKSDLEMLVVEQLAFSVKQSHRLYDLSFVRLMQF